MTDPAATEGRATGITMEELALAAGMSKWISR